jgi:hypothetical protein
MILARLSAPLLGVLLLFFEPPVALAGQSLTLASGTAVEILSIGPMTSTAGSAALVLKYQTATNLGDVSKLRQESDELWDRFVIDAEKGRYDQAIISANAPATGGTSAGSHDFVYKKQGSSWHTVESAADAKSRTLDAERVTAFVARVDWLMDQGKFNSLLLYFADDFTSRVTTVDPPGIAPTTLDRAQFMAVGRQSYAELKDVRYRREIIGIVIAPDGRSAEVKSHETMEAVDRGRRFASDALTTDVFEFDGETMQAKTSTTDIKSIARDM